MSKPKKSMSKPAMTAEKANEYLNDIGFRDGREGTQYHSANVHGDGVDERFMDGGAYGAIQITKIHKMPKLKITVEPDSTFTATVYVQFDKKGWGLSVMPTTNASPIEYAHALMIALHVAVQILTAAQNYDLDFGMEMLDGLSCSVVMVLNEYE